MFIGLETAIITIFEEKDKDSNYGNTPYIVVFSNVFKSPAWRRSIMTLLQIEDENVKDLANSLTNEGTIKML